MSKITLEVLKKEALISSKIYRGYGDIEKFLNTLESKEYTIKELLNVYFTYKPKIDRLTYKDKDFSDVCRFLGIDPKMFLYTIETHKYTDTDVDVIINKHIDLYTNNLIQRTKSRIICFLFYNVNKCKNLKTFVQYHIKYNQHFNYMFLNQYCNVKEHDLLLNDLDYFKKIMEFYLKNDLFIDYNDCLGYTHQIKWFDKFFYYIRHHNLGEEFTNKFAIAEKHRKEKQAKSNLS